MTARDDLRRALLDHTQETSEHAPEADRLINAAISEAIETQRDLLHFCGRPAPGESGYARDQLIIAFRGGEEGEFGSYGWDTAVMMADRVVRSIRVEADRESAAKIRAEAGATDGGTDDYYVNGMNAAADLIEPEVTS